MRIQVLCGPVPHLVETIGEAVTITGMPADSCAVHAATNGRGFTVSHLDSGYSIASGETIDAAIQAAEGRVKLAALHPKKMLAGLRAATRARQAVEFGSANEAAR